MPEFLEEDLQNPRGYVITSGRPTPSQAVIALTKDGVCVFGKTRRTPVPSTTFARLGWMVYDDEVERQRRLLADTALALVIIDNPRFARSAIDDVTRGIRTYWQALSMRLDNEAIRSLVKDNQKYVSGKEQFGRVTTTLPSDTELTEFKSIVNKWIEQLASTPVDLPKVMSLQDMFLRIYKKCGPADGTPMDVSPHYRDMAANQKRFKQDWYGNAELRGREHSSVQASLSQWPGLLSLDMTIQVGDPLERCGIDLYDLKVEERKRAIDIYVIKAGAMELAFKKVLAEYNLPFSASASGTTSTLLTSAKTFGAGGMTNADSLKQYLLGCIAYLVGGGMHTCHEVFVTAALADLPYQPGKYLDMFPTDFKNSIVFNKWANEFWEIVRPDREKVR